MSPDEALKKSQALRGNADSAAGHVRGLYISFLVLAVYIGVIIGSTSDEQLLRVEPVTLPILGVGLPIVSFYALVPWLFVLLHFNILLQHYLLSRKLHLFAAALAEIPDPTVRDEQRAQLFSFPFSHMLVPGPEGGLMRLFYGIMVWSTLILLPLGILLWAQIRFLPYHDPVSTWSQRGAIALDVALLWLFWPRTLTPGLRLIDQLRGIVGSWAASRRVALPLSLVSGAVLLLSFFVALVPGEGMERAGLSIKPLTRALFDSPNAPFHRSLQLAEAVLVQGGASAQVTAALRSGDGERQRDMLPQISGLVLANRDLRFADLRGAILVKADLRGAALDGARLGKANLSRANLGPFEAAPARGCASDLAVEQGEIDALAGLPDPQSFWLDAGVTQPVGDGRFKLCRSSVKAASLSHAVLNNAVLSFAWIEGTALPRASMDGANFSKAVLRQVRAPGASLESARFTLARAEGLNLQDAQIRLSKFDRALVRSLSLRGATASEVRFDGTRLEQVDGRSVSALRASFAGATLIDVSLSGAKLGQGVFDDATLKDVDFTGSDMSSTTFERAEVSGLRLNRADMKGAKMAGLDLSGTQMVKAKLSGADLSRAKLIAVEAREVELKGTDLAEADLRGADLAGARIQGSDLSGADLTGSRLQDADLLGVFLVEAKLQAAHLERARFRGVDLTGARLDPHFMSRQLFTLGKASSSDGLNLLDTRFAALTEAERSELDAAVTPHAKGQSAPWRQETNDHATGAVDWPILGRLAYCRKAACLDLERFAAIFSKNLGTYACRDSAGQAIILRHFPLIRGEAAETIAYKRSIASRLVESQCNPRFELSDRLSYWTSTRQ